MSALFIVVLLTLFSFAMAETDQVTFTITVEQNLPDFANIQHPGEATISQGGECTFYAQVYEAGKTDPAGQFTDIIGWIGYNTNANADLSDASWTWVLATYNADATGTGNNDEYYAEIASSLPVGTYYVASRFVFTGDPDNSTYGLYTDVNTSLTDLAVLTVEPSNAAPIFTQIADQVMDEDTEKSIALIATDADNDTLSYSIISNDQADNISLTISNDTLYIVPAQDYFTVVPANITLKVSDGHGGEDITSFKLTVNPVNDAPVIAAVDPQTVIEGNEIIIDFSATDVDNSPSELTWSASGIPTGSVFTDNGDGSAKLVWTPDYTQAGVYENIVITVDDGVAQSQSLVIKTNNNSNR